MSWSLRLVALVIGLSCAPAWAVDFVVVQAKINPVVYPKTVGDAFAECLRDTACSTLANAAASYVGVPPGAMTAAKAIVGGGKPSDSEEGRYAVSLPGGYTYCRSQIHMLSVVPADGKRASIFSASSTKSGLSIYTWTPKRGLGQGRSWVDADVTVYGVREAKFGEAKAAGRCVDPGKVLQDCRGNGSGDRKGCDSVKD